MLHMMTGGKEHEKPMPKVQEHRNEHRQLETIQVELKMILALSYFELNTKVGNSTKLFIADDIFDILIQAYGTCDDHCGNTMLDILNGMTYDEIGEMLEKELIQVENDINQMRRVHLLSKY